MHEKRNAAVTMLFCLALLWGLLAWLIAPDFWPTVPPSLLFHKIASVVAALGLGALLWYYLAMQDKCDDELAKVTSGEYYEQDGLCFMPLIRLNRDGHAEISLYYQNRYANSCEAVVHLRPPAGAFASHRGARDVHFAFRSGPGAFGVVHQPVAVSPRVQGEVVEVQMGAAVRWPIGKGDLIRSRCGIPSGTFNLDWALAYRQSDRELGGAIKLINPTTLHLPMPWGASPKVTHTHSTQETLTALT